MTDYYTISQIKRHSGEIFCDSCESTMEIIRGEWMHIIDLRAAPTAHPQMRELMIPLLVDLYTNIPILFNRSYGKYCTTNA